MYENLVNIHVKRDHVNHIHLDHKRCPWLSFCISHWESVCGLSTVDASGLILNVHLIILLSYRQGNMTAPSDIKSHLLFFLCLRYPQARQGGLSCHPSPPDLRRQVPQGTMWPIQAPNRKAHPAFSPSILTVYMTSLGKPHPLHLLYCRYQSNLLTLIGAYPHPLTSETWPTKYKRAQLYSYPHIQTHVADVPFFSLALPLSHSYKSLCWSRWQIWLICYLRFIWLDWPH